MASKRGVVLLVEDDASVLQAVGDALKEAGYEVLRAGNGRDGLLMLTHKVDLVVTDLWMPIMDGLALLEKVKGKQPLTEVVMITGNATVASAVQAMKLGAFDYLTKPFTPPELLEVVERAVEHRRMREEITRWGEGEGAAVKGEEAAGESPLIENLIGRSVKMQAVYETIRRVAPFKSTVLVQGESGTGKEMVVRAIHELSPRKGGPLVPINCAAVPASLMESELFGHERGAFTGAATRTAGYFEAAHHGTLFIDEVGELDVAVQAKLLRVLETGKVMAVGSTREKVVDVRLLAATNSDLRLAVEDKGFRSDLFYRLNVVRIDLPALRERLEDIPLLVGHLLERLCVEVGLPAPVVEPGVIEAMQKYGWPGNVRELRNVLESVLILGQKAVLTAADLPEHIREGKGVAGASAVDLDMAEKEALERALRQCGGDRTRVAGMVGVSVRTLYRKMARYGLR